MRRKRRTLSYYNMWPRSGCLWSWKKWKNIIQWKGTSSMSILVIHLMIGFIISIDFGKLFIKIWYLFLIKAHDNRNPVCTCVCNSHTHTHTHQVSCLMVGHVNSLEVHWLGLGAITARVWGSTPDWETEIPHPHGTDKNKTINYLKNDGTEVSE